MNRRAAPTAIATDFAEALSLLAEQMGIGAKYEGTRVPNVRPERHKRRPARLRAESLRLAGRRWRRPFNSALSGTILDRAGQT